jgi:hypothetical protein
VRERAGRGNPAGRGPRCSPGVDGRELLNFRPPRQLGLKIRERCGGSRAGSGWQSRSWTCHEICDARCVQTLVALLRAVLPTGDSMFRSPAEGRSSTRRSTSASLNSFEVQKPGSTTAAKTEASVL